MLLGVSQRTVAKWLTRYRAEGEAGLADRCSRPHGMPSATPADVVKQVIALRRHALPEADRRNARAVACNGQPGTAQGAAEPHA